MNRRRRHNPNAAAGFSFVEVLAAIVLAAIVLPVAMRGIVEASSAASLSRKRIEATHLAQYKMNELLITAGYDDTRQSGDFDDLGDRWEAYRWSSTADVYDTDTFRQLDVSVTFQHNGGERAVTLQTVVYVGEDG